MPMRPPAKSRPSARWTQSHNRAQRMASPDMALISGLASSDSSSPAGTPSTSGWNERVVRQDDSM